MEEVAGWVTLAEQAGWIRCLVQAEGEAKLQLMEVMERWASVESLGTAWMLRWEMVDVYWLAETS